MLEKSGLSIAPAGYLLVDWTALAIFAEISNRRVTRLEFLVHLPLSTQHLHYTHGSEHTQISLSVYDNRDASYMLNDSVWPMVTWFHVTSAL